jgi:hypothetical protein
MACTPECKTVFDEIKRKKNAFCIMGVGKDEDNKDAIVVKKHDIIGDGEEKAINDSSFPEVVEFIKKNYSAKPAYLIIVAEYEVKESGGSDRSTSGVFFFNWCPDNCNVKEKMVHSSSFTGVKNALEGAKFYLQVTDFDELQEALEDVKSGKRK